MTRDLIAEIERAQSCNGDWKWLVEELVGSEQLWLRACRQAVAQGREDWLARYLPGHADPHWLLGLMVCCIPENEGIASAIAACAQAALLLRRFSSSETDLARATAAVMNLHEAAVRWQWAHLQDPRMVGEPDARVVSTLRSALRRADRPQQQLESLVRELKQIHAEWQLAPVPDLIPIFLRDEVDARQKAVRVPIPVDLGLDGGAMVTLVLESRATGIGEACPDPWSTAFLHGDTNFQEAHERAWAYAVMAT